MHCLHASCSAYPSKFMMQVSSTSFPEYAVYTPHIVIISDRIYPTHCYNIRQNIPHTLL